MIDFEVNRKSLDDWRAGVSRRFRRHLVGAQEEIRRDWIYELDRQRTSYGDGTWQGLDENYQKRKDREHAAGRFPHNSILKRTGSMMAGYVGGISFETTRTTVGVSMPYPTGRDLMGRNIFTRAITTQEWVGGGRRYRPFDVDPFIEIAYDKFNEAMSRAANNE